MWGTSGRRTIRSEKIQISSYGWDEFLAHYE